MSLLLWKDMEGIFFGQLVWTSCSSRSFCRSLIDVRQWPCQGSPRGLLPASACWALLAAESLGSGMSPLAEEMIAERTDRGLRLSRHLATFQKIAVESSP